MIYLAILTPVDTAGTISADPPATLIAVMHILVSYNAVAYSASLLLGEYNKYIASSSFYG